MNSKTGLLLLGLLPTVWGCGPAKLEERVVTQAIQRQLDTLTLAKASRSIGRQLDTVAVANDRRGRQESGDSAAAALARFYEGRENRAVWFDERARPTQAAAELIGLLRSAPAHGLDPETYRAAAGAAQSTPEEQALPPDQRAERLAERDVALSQAFLSYGADLSGGRLDPRETRMNWYAADQPADLIGALDRAAATGEVSRELTALAPAALAYAELRAALAEYRKLEARGGWAELPGEQILKPGDQGVPVTMLRNRLAFTGELAAAVDGAPDGATAVFDEQLAEAVRAFQERHGLEVTGRVDAQTRQALNVPVAERIRTIELNLERWRWLPPALGERYLMVNVPAFELEAVENDATVLRMRVVVGRTVSQTPALSDTMTHIVVNPSWHVPDGIARAELLPKGADYLAQNNYEVEYDERGHARVRQRPGANNALGKIKFMFPNNLNIYLHDTPADHLFARTERDFSHGCIRVEQPLALAEYVLRGNSEWTEPRLTSVIDSGSTVDVRLPEPLPVYILYWTAWVDEAGRVQFRDDLYGKDKLLDQALRRGNPALGQGSVAAGG